MTDVDARLRFGPAGNSQAFYDEGGKRTLESLAWQKEHFGLDAFEVPFGRGISMGEEAAAEIGLAAKRLGISLSAHAPYYINLASHDAQLAGKSIRYILDSARLLHTMGGRRLVVHVGSPKGQSRDAAMRVIAGNLRQTRDALNLEGLQDIRLCLETMGRPGLIGSMDEIIELVLVDDRFLPCVDFAHLHAIGQGALNSAADFSLVLDKLESGLGTARAAQAHMHFSRIEYGPKGEVRHKTFADEGYGPDFKLLAPLLARRGYMGTVICESRGTMAEDAHSMRLSYLEALGAAGESASNPPARV